MEPTNLPWITKDGYFDPAKLPIECVLKQAVGDDESQFRSALRVLQSMYLHGRKEAGVFLFGLLLTCEDQWDKRIAIVEALNDIETPSCVDLLFQELKRVKSSNTTRRYLTHIINILAAMPSKLVLPGFSSLVNDKSFSPRMRDKFKAILNRESMEDADLF